MHGTVASHGLSAIDELMSVFATYQN